MSEAPTLYFVTIPPSRSRRRKAHKFDCRHANGHGERLPADAIPHTVDDCLACGGADRAATKRRHPKTATPVADAFFKHITSGDFLRTTDKGKDKGAS